MSRIHRHFLALAAVAGLAFCGRARAAEIGGTVMLTPGGQPSSGVWVSAVRIGDILTSPLTDQATPPRGPARAAVTDARGVFTFRDLAPGAYQVSVRADSLPPTLAPGGRPVNTVLVSAKDATSIDLTVTRLARFEGTARRMGGGALAGVRVQAFHHGDNTAFAETWTDDQGRFHFDGLERDAPVDLLTTTSEGQFGRATKTPLRAGPQPVEVVLPAWSPSSKRHVVLTVTLPTSGERRYELDWVSNPESAPTGYRTTISLDRDGQGELDSPNGVFLVRVRELGAPAGRSWTASRLVRVDAGVGPLNARVDLNTEPNPEPSPDSTESNPGP